MKQLQLNQLNKDLIKTLEGSFINLPHTDHTDGTDRLRRYSAIELRTTFWNATRETEITRLPDEDFTQSEEYNEHQGGMVRKFENIEDSTLQSDAFKEICSTYKRVNRLSDGQRVCVHQMRVITLGDATPVAPEGVHQDGYDCIAMIGINRHNIKGGNLIAYTDKDAPPILAHTLEVGQMLFLNDREMWHYATDLERIDESQQGYGDWFILCASR